MKPLVSVVIPCFNAARWVCAAIESARRQSYGAVEVIVVDDGSTDDSVAIVTNSHPGVKLISTPNRGPSSARNQGLSMASGEWIQFLDADDLLHPDKLRLSLEVYVPHPDVQFVWAPHTSISETFCLDETKECSQSGVRLTQNALESPYVPSASVFRTSFLKRVGPWNESLRRWVDLEYQARIAAHQPLYARLSEPLYLYRTHGGAERLSNSELSPAYSQQAFSALKIATATLESSPLAPDTWKPYVWPFYLHLARAAARQGDRSGFIGLLTKAVRLRGTRRFRFKCAVACASATILGARRTDQAINAFLSLRTAKSATTPTSL